jgi:hypothetical protein
MESSERSASDEQLLRRIRGEYLEMPGLRLTCEQAQRLWGLDAPTCASLLACLVDARFLQRSVDGQYARIGERTVHRVPVRMTKADINRDRWEHLPARRRHSTR